MVFDPERHELDPATGFQVDKDTKLPSGLVGRPPMPASDEKDYPKWVAPHESYIVVKKSDGAPDHVSVPAWPEFFVGRDGAVTVLVNDKDEEGRAVAGEKAEAPALVEASEENKDDAHDL